MGPPERFRGFDPFADACRAGGRSFDASLFTLTSEYRVRVAPSFETDSDVLAGTLLGRDGERVPWLEEAPDVSDALAGRNRSLDWDVPA